MNRYFTLSLLSLLMTQPVSAITSHDNNISCLQACTLVAYSAIVESLFIENNQETLVTNDDVLSFIYATLSQAGIPNAETIEVYQSPRAATGYYPGYRAVSISSDLYWELSSEFCTFTGTFPNGYKHRFASSIDPEVLKKHWLALFEIAPHINRAGFTAAIITQLASFAAIEGLWHTIAPYIGCEQYRLNNTDYEQSMLYAGILILGKTAAGLAAGLALLKTQEYGKLGCKPVADY